jgi:hypothetical protein
LGHLSLSRPFHEKDKRLGQPSAYKTQHLLYPHLLIPYCGKGSFLFLEVDRQPCCGSYIVSKESLLPSLISIYLFNATAYLCARTLILYSFLNPRL